MQRYEVSASARIPAPAERAYAILADYTDGHRRILPRPYFTDLRVERGGVGAGTEYVVAMRVMGRALAFHGAISEPEPGRVMVEQVRENGTTTTFTVEPAGAACQVTIRMELASRPGLAGGLERWLTRRLFRRVLGLELAQLAAVAAQGA